MPVLELTAAERDTLVTALESYLPELTTERIGTDNREWHVELKKQEQILAELVTRLKQAE